MNSEAADTSEALVDAARRARTLTEEASFVEKLLITVYG